MRFKAFEPSWGVLLVLVAGVITFVKPLRWEQWSLSERRQSAAKIAAGLCILASACWFQWIYQLEAITPVDPDQQSAYSYGTFAERHHWHDIRAEREHYWGDDIRSLEPRRLVRDLDKVTAIAAGVAGINRSHLPTFGARRASKASTRCARGVWCARRAVSVPGWWFDPRTWCGYWL